MRHYKYFAYILVAIMGASCTKSIDIKSVDPNNPTDVPAALILGTVLTDMSGTGTQGSLGGINSWSEVSQWDQYVCQNYDYYGNNIYSWTATSASFDPYLVMKNVVQMDNEEFAASGKTVNAYEAVGRFIQAYYYYNLTSMYGDVPQVQALLANSGNTTPAYTPQQQVFQYVLSQLDTANSDLATLIAADDNSLSTTQDIYFAGNLAAWQKTVNSFKLRVLISLSNQASTTGLNVASQFANIINNPTTYPIFASTADDLAFVYNPGGSDTYSTYPFNPSNFGSIAGRYNMAYTYVNLLDSLSDPRVFATCEPAWALITNSTDSANAAQFKFFVGASSGEAIGTMYNQASANEISFINRARYYSNFTGTPDVLVGYKEMCFNIAEAIERGWVSGSAETWYKTGITQSMTSYGISTTSDNQTATFLPPGANAVTQVANYSYTFDFNSWYASSLIALSGNTATAINQIVEQKYIACFINSGYEGYYNWRRTGVPAFQGGSGIGNNGVLPVRWEYPVGEETQNTTNWQAALTNQGFSEDDLNQVMWLLK